MATQKQTSPMASHLVAKAQGIPERFLLKVLKPLVSAGVLHSVKGPNGGYRLARSPSDVTLLDVIEAVDGPVRGQAPVTDAHSAALDKRLDAICNEAADQTRRQLQKVRISDLAKKS
jgi:Rrf2 family protein